jgi:hypothetical protein
MDLAKLKPTDLPERRPGMTETEWVLEMLLSRKGSKAHKAGRHILLTGGSAAIPLLINAAVMETRKPAHAIRLLELMLEIGGSLSGEDYSRLVELSHHRSEKVSDKAQEVLLTLCPDGPPPLIPPEILKPIIDDCYRQADEVKRRFGLRT